MKYPKFLTKNTKICLVSPSFSCSTMPYSLRLEKAIEYFKNNQYVIQEGKYIRKPFSSTHEAFTEKAEEINEIFQAEEDSILLSVGGGFFMYALLPYFDFVEFSKNPKWFMGYSDNTHLTFLLPTLCDIASIYGPNFPDFGLKDLHLSLYDALDLLKGKKLTMQNYPSFSFNVENEDPLGAWIFNHSTKVVNYPNQNLQFSGRLIGGCLDILMLYLGTKYDHVKSFSKKYQEDKIIWFFEACDLSLFQIYLSLLQLKNASWFNHVSGFIFGRPLKAYGETFMDLNHHTAIIKILGDLNVPIILDADIGHVKPQMPLICGSYCEVESKENTLSISMKLI